MTNLIDKILNYIQALDDEMTLKSDYTEELEELDQLENSLKVARTYNAPVWKVENGKKQIKQIREWINAEMGVM